MSTSVPKFQIFLGTDRQFYFRLRAAGNHEIILNSSEGYKTKVGCLNGISSVKTHAPNDSRYSRKQTSTTYGIRYYFTLEAFNGETIGKSELYNTAHDREMGVSLVKRSAVFATTEDLVPHLTHAG